MGQHNDTNSTSVTTNGDLTDKVDNLATIVGDLATTVGGLTATVNDLTSTVNGLAATVDTLTTRLDGLAATVDTLTTRLDGLAATVDTLAMVTKKGFDEMNERFEKVDERFEMTDQKIMKESQATRDYVSKEVARASAEAITRDQTLDDKGNTVADTLERKNVLSGEEAARIKNISPFPAAAR